MMTLAVRLTSFGVLTLVALTGLPGVGAQAREQAPASVACSLTWLGQEAAIEDYLRSAKVAKFEQVPIGVTKPHRARFDTGGPVASAAWKPLAPSYRSGYRESYKAELAAYALDRLLDMHQVPPVVERRLDNNTGALVFWIENVKAWNTKKPPSGPGLRWAQQVSRMRLFDQLTANIDRNAGNLLYDDDWHLFLIDHSRAFTERKDIKMVTAPARVERAFWNKIEALDMPTLQATLGEWLSSKEIEAILERRSRMREAINKMVAERGEANVFF
jgi:hypothetical protein